jgi:chromosome segregation ATPase
MSIIYIGMGAAAGIAVSYYFQNKRILAVDFKNSNEKDFLISQNKKCKDELEEVKNELAITKGNLKKGREEMDSAIDNREDREFEVAKLKKNNSDLAQEIEKLKADLYEYEMLYNARKEEVSELKKQLGKNG